jgi:hypothetical protein
MVNSGANMIFLVTNNIFLLFPYPVFGSLSVRKTGKVLTLIKPFSGIPFPPISNGKFISARYFITGGKKIFAGKEEN